MSKKLKIGHFVDGVSVIHYASPTLKIAVFFLLAILTFFITRPIELVLGLSLFLILCAISKINPLLIIKSVWGILLFLVLLACLNMFVVNTGNEICNFWIIHITDDGLNRAIVYAGRLAILLLLGALLLATTSPISVTDGLARMFAPLKHLGVPVQMLAMILSLAIRFVPVIADEAATIATAQKCRGADVASGGITGRAKFAISLVVPVVMSSLQHAEKLSLALMSKSYEPGAPRTSWNYFEFKKRQSRAQTHN